MTRTRLIVCLVASLGFVTATAAPALAEDGYSTICVVVTNDRNNPGAAPLCVWVPVDKAN